MESPARDPTSSRAFARPLHFFRQCGQRRFRRRPSPGPLPAEQPGDPSSGRDDHGQPEAIEERGGSRRLGAPRDQIEKWLDTDGLTVVKVHELLGRRGVVVPERTLYRYVLEELGVGRSARGSTVRVADGEPGDELQVDFGKLGGVPDPGTGKRRDCWALVFTPVVSRFSFVWLTHRQTLGDVIAGFEAAWVFFGGVFATVIPDNMKTIVDGADPIEPRFNEAFVEYAQARGFVIDPARVRSPQDKPRVERVVPYVRNNFFAGETFIDLADAQRRVEVWARERAGMRVHGTTQTRPAEHFRLVGQPVLAGTDRALRRAGLRDGEGSSGSSHRGGRGAVLGAREPDRHPGRRPRRPPARAGVLPGSARQGPPPPGTGRALHRPRGGAPTSPWTADSAWSVVSAVLLHSPHSHLRSRCTVERRQGTCSCVPSRRSGVTDVWSH